MSSTTNDNNEQQQRLQKRQTTDEEEKKNLSLSSSSSLPPTDDHLRPTTGVSATTASWQRPTQSSPKQQQQPPPPFFQSLPSLPSVRQPNYDPPPLSSLAEQGASFPQVTSTSTSTSATTVDYGTDELQNLQVVNCNLLERRSNRMSHQNQNNNNNNTIGRTISLEQKQQQQQMQMQLQSFITTTTTMNSNYCSSSSSNSNNNNHNLPPSVQTTQQSSEPLLINSNNNNNNDVPYPSLFVPNQPQPQQSGQLLWLPPTPTPGQPQTQVQPQTPPQALQPSLQQQQQQRQPSVSTNHNTTSSDDVMDVLDPTLVAIVETNKQKTITKITTTTTTTETKHRRRVGRPPVMKQKLKRNKIERGKKKKRRGTTICCYQKRRKSSSSSFVVNSNSNNNNNKRSTTVASSSSFSSSSSLRGNNNNNNNKRIIIDTDHDPKRLVNPLLEVPYVTIGNSNNSDNHTSTTTSSTTFVPTTTTTSTSQLHSKKKQKMVVTKLNVHDVLEAYTSMSHIIPDTYTLSYHARLLGFSVPIYVPYTTTYTPSSSLSNNNNNNNNYGSTNQQQQPYEYVPMDVDNLLVVGNRNKRNQNQTKNTTSDAIHVIPPLGTWYEQVQGRTKVSKSLSSSSLSSSSTQNVHFHHVDPLYVTLLSSSSSSSVLTKANPIAATNTIIPPISNEDQRHVDMTLRPFLRHGMGGDGDGDGDGDDSDTNIFKTTNCSIRTIVKERNNNNNVNNNRGSTLEQRLFVVTLDTVQVTYDFSWFPIDDDDNNNDNTNTIKTNNNSTTTTTAVTTNNNNNNNNTTRTTTNSGSRRRVSELILYVHDVRIVGNTVNNNNKDDDEDDGTVVVANVDVDTVIKMTTVQVEVQLLIVTCLVLHHARTYNVWYGLWTNVPQEWCYVFRTYFDMTSLSSSNATTATTTGTTTNSKSNNSNVEATDGDTQMSNGNRTVSLVCDLHQCSTRYAGLLFQRRMHDKGRKQRQQQQQPKTQVTMRQRMLVRLPTVDQALSSSPSSISVGGGSSTTTTPSRTTNPSTVVVPTCGSSSKKKKSTKPRAVSNNKRSSSSVTISSAGDGVRNVAFGIRVNRSNLQNSSSNGTVIRLQLLNGSGQVVVGGDGDDDYDEHNRHDPVVIRRTKKREPSIMEPTRVLPPTTNESVRTIGKFPPTATSKQRNLQDGPADGTKSTTTANINPLPDNIAGNASVPMVQESASSTFAAPTGALSTAAVPPSWEVLKVFDQVVPNSFVVEDDEILQELKAKQDKLVAMEGGLEDKARTLLRHMVDERMNYEKNADDRQKERDMLKAYDKILERRKEIDVAWQKQLEQDMDAVCDICKDGEVTPDNQILFCEACNVAVHQMCYGIEEVPEGDYYCIACRYLGRDKMSEALSHRGGAAKRMAPSPLPICCELCPLKQGAFVRSDTSSLPSTRPDGNSTNVVSKWVHVVCAKWQGLNFEPRGQTDVVEDVQPLKRNFLRHGYSCILCLGQRGAYVKCRHEGCESWMHITCARASGLCEVTHGENCHGDVKENPWTLRCPNHSTIDPASIQDRVTIEQLVRSAEEFPPEPPVEPLKVRPTKVFNKMNDKERHKFLADPDYEQELLDELSKKLQGVHCEVCQQFEEDGKNLKKCMVCNVVFCMSCVLPTDLSPDDKDYKCPACAYVSDKQKNGDDYEVPQCTMCFQRGGWLRPAYAEPINRKAYWKQNPREFNKTLFAKDLWCHALCSMWHPRVTVQPNGQVDCSNIVMTNGRGHILGNVRCSLCGDSRKMKVACSEEGCRCWGQKRPFNFHITCSREAGLEVQDKVDESNRYHFDAKCFQHSGSDFVFRARLEDLIEIERRRAGKRFEKSYNIMSLAHASRLYNKAIVVMRMLGWAWRWAEWWVEFGDNWEPLLEPGEREEDMTKEELKIVDTTRESRCKAARRCRLAAFGAALRNRDYDKEDGDDKVALDRALRAVLHTPELVGPLEQYEIDFFAEWLSRVYRSKSRLLGYGEDKIPIKHYTGTLHLDDKSPKFILGDRRLPGKQELPEGDVFESDFQEVDDFLKPEMFEDGTLVTSESLRFTRKRRARRDEDDGEKPSSKICRRGMRSMVESPSEDAKALNNDSFGESARVTLSAVYSTEIGAKEAISRVQLLASPIEALVPATLAAGVPRKRKSSDSATQRRGRRARSSDASSPDYQSGQQVTPAPMRRGRAPSKNRTERPPKSSADQDVQPTGEVAIVTRRRGPGRQSRSTPSIEDHFTRDTEQPATTRMDGSPASPSSLSNTAGATAGPKKRARAISPRARTTLEEEVLTNSTRRSTPFLRKAPTDPNSSNGNVAVCIAERIKARHASTGVATNTFDENQNSEVAEDTAVESHNAIDAVEQGDVGKKTDVSTSTERTRDSETSTQQNPNQSGTSNTSVDSSLEVASTDDQGEIPIAEYVKRQRLAQGFASVRETGPASSDSSSESDAEILNEMTAIERGRLRGRMNAMREMQRR